MQLTMQDALCRSVPAVIGLTASIGNHVRVSMADRPAGRWLFLNSRTVLKRALKTRLIYMGDAMHRLRPKARHFTPFGVENMYGLMQGGRDTGNEQARKSQFDPRHVAHRLSLPFTVTTTEHTKHQFRPIDNFAPVGLPHGLLRRTAVPPFSARAIVLIVSRHIRRTAAWADSLRFSKSLGKERMPDHLAVQNLAMFLRLS